MILRKEDNHNLKEEIIYTLILTPYSLYTFLSKITY